MTLIGPVNVLPPSTDFESRTWVRLSGVAPNVSMPFPTQFPEGGNSAGSVFYGDYAGLDADTLAHPFWSDTRNPDLFLCPASVSTTPAVCGGTTLGTTLNDQEAYTANQSVSSSQ